MVDEQKKHVSTVVKVWNVVPSIGCGSFIYKFHMGAELVAGKNLQGSRITLQ